MKRRTIIISAALSLIVGLGFLFVSGVSAQGPLLSQSLIDEAECSGGECSLNTFMKVGIQVAEIILGLVGALSLIMFVYGGVVWLISGGSAEQVSKGKEIILGSVIGLLIVFGSYTIIKFVVNDVLQVTNDYKFDGNLPEDSVPQAIGSRCEGNGGRCINNTAACVDTWGQPGQLIATDCGQNKKCCKDSPAPTSQCTSAQNNGQPNRCDAPTCSAGYSPMPSPALPCQNNRICCQFGGIGVGS